MSTQQLKAIDLERREAAINEAAEGFRNRIADLTGSSSPYAHPNLVAAIGAVERAERELLKWARNLEL